MSLTFKQPALEMLAPEMSVPASLLDEPTVTSHVPVYRGFIPVNEFAVTAEHKQPCDVRYSQMGRFASAALLELSPSAELPTLVDGSNSSDFTGLPLDALMVIRRGIRYQSSVRINGAGVWHGVRIGHSNSKYFHDVMKSIYQRKQPSR